MRKLLFSIVALGGLAAAGWYVLGHQSSSSANEPAWRTVAIDRGSIIAAVNATGSINPTATAIVGSQVSGQVLEILADYNSAVKAGDVLARLNVEQATARLDAARAELAAAAAQNAIQKAQVDRVKADIARLGATRTDAIANIRKAEAQLADAQTTLNRQMTLNQRQIASEVALQQARLQQLTSSAAREQAQAQLGSVDAQEQALAADLRIAEAQVLSGEAQIQQRQAIVRQIEVDIRNSEVRSPVDGVVIQRNIELGQTVAASLQAPTLFLVAQDLTRVEIYANIDESDVGRVQPGQPVSFTVTAFPAREFSGTVKTVRLGSQTVQNVVIYTAVIEVRNDDTSLKPGMTATIRIFTERRENVLRVANTALRWRPPGEQPGAAAPAAPPNPFSVAPAGGPPGQPGGQNAQRQMLERLATELKLDDAQKRQLDEFARAARQGIVTQGPAETPDARRERGRQVALAIADKLKPILRAEQLPLLDAWTAERAAQRAGATGVPGRIYVPDADGKPQLVSVRLGATDGTNTEILSGVEEGRRAIIGGGPRGRAGGAGRPPVF